jgi:transposase-like protein
VREWEKGAPAEQVESAKEEARLRKRIRELEEEIEILKRFTRYWVKEEGKGARARREGTRAGPAGSSARGRGRDRPPAGRVSLAWS